MPRHDSTDGTEAAPRQALLRILRRRISALRQLEAAKLRYALLYVFDNHPDVPIADALWSALATVVDSDDAVEPRALKLIKIGLDALVSKRDHARRTVSELYAPRHRFKNANSDAFAIFEIAEAVEWAAYLYHHRNPVLTDGGPAAVEQLCGFLARRFGQAAPGWADVQAWIAMHSPKGARGKLTTAGIVARIVHRSRLLGARGDDEGKTLRRVENVLKRHGFTPLVK